MISKKKRKRYKKTIAKFCLMDDTFMAKFFENNIEGTEYLLHLILENDKIRVEKVIGQYSIANLQGAFQSVGYLRCGCTGQPF